MLFGSFLCICTIYLFPAEPRDNSKASTLQGSADYFITSGDKIRFFFEKGVFDDKGAFCEMI